jgi:broad specificity phosphatase PhoE
MRDDPHFAPHGGESPLRVAQRFTGALRRIASAHGEARVVVVAHGGALSMAFAELIDGDYTQWKRVMDNCAVSELRLHPTPSLPRFNHIDHLRDL